MNTSRRHRLAETSKSRCGRGRAPVASAALHDAAPELLKACKRILCTLESLPDQLDKSGSPELAKMTRRRLEFVAAAISKAEQPSDPPTADFKLRDKYEDHPSPRRFQMVVVHGDGRESIFSEFVTEASAAHMLAYSAARYGSRLSWAAREIDVASIRLLPPGKAGQPRRSLIAKERREIDANDRENGDKRTKRWQERFGRKAKRQSKRVA